MTVAEIQEYIIKRNKEYDKIKDEYQDAKFKQATADLIIVLGMLDELEPNKQIMWERDMAIKQLKDLGFAFGEEVKSYWTKMIGEDEGDYYYICEKCGSTSETADKHCSYCGAIMDKVKEGRV